MLNTFDSGRIMDSDNNQVAGSDLEEEEEEEQQYRRPPSSYGSMKSESDDLVERSDEEQEEEGGGGGGGGEEVVFVPPDPPAPPVIGSQMLQSQYTETLCTETTQQTKPPGALVIDTGSADLEDLSEEELDDEDEILMTCSPEPPEPLEMEGLIEADENSQPGRLDPELDLPHIFKSMQDVLSQLNSDDLFKVKIWYNKWDSVELKNHILCGDVLDFVDKIIELYGQHQALTKTIDLLESMDKKEQVKELKTKCRKAIFRFYLIETLNRKYNVIREGVSRPGKQRSLNEVYVVPQISIRGFGGVHPDHEILPHCPTPLQVPSEDSFVALNDLFRLKKEDGSLVKTVVTTGVPGSGMSVCMAKFCLDWAEEVANKDIQYVIKLSLHHLRALRERTKGDEAMSMYELLEYCHSPLKALGTLEEENTRYLIVMQSLDCFEPLLDWKNTPVLTDHHVKADIDTLIVNLVRGNLLPIARIWILGRRAAVSQIPSELVDVTAELQGFTDEMKDEYLTKRYKDPRVGERIVRQYKRVPSIQILARHPFICWQVASVFNDCFKYPGYGSNRPRLTPFLIRFMIVQINRRLKFYRFKRNNELSWTNEEEDLIIGLGKMSLKLLEMKTSVFTVADLKEVNVDLNEAVLYSGLCTEVIPTVISGKRTFCFSNYTIQEFMAALYVFLMFHLQSKNVLEGGFLQLPRFFSSKYNSKSAAGLVQCAVARTLNSSLGHYDLFLRYLCGLLSLKNSNGLLRGFLYSHRVPKVEGLNEVEQVLEQTITTAPEDRKRNLYECVRELTQEDD